MKSKIFTVFTLAILMFSLMGTFVLAEEDDVFNSKALNLANDESKASTNVFWERVRIMFTFNKEKKAEIALKIADKRALKVGQLLEEGMPEKARKYVEKHREAVEEAEDNFEDIANNGDEESVLNALKATVRMQYRFDLHKEKFLDIFSKILERQSEIMNEEGLAHIIDVFSNIEAKSEEAENRIEQKQDNFIARYKIITGATEEEIEALLDGFESEFEEAKEQRQERIQERENSIEDRKNRIKERIQDLGESEDEEETDN